MGVNIPPFSPLSQTKRENLIIRRTTCNLQKARPSTCNGQGNFVAIKVTGVGCDRFAK